MADNDTTSGNAKNRLGRGLASLIGDMNPSETGQADASKLKPDTMAPIEHVQANPHNPRRVFVDAELQELAKSIEEHGIVQPILVRAVQSDASANASGVKYEIIAGERRWRAAQKAGLHEVPILIRQVEDRQALEIAIIENVQRADLNAMEEAAGYQQLMDEYKYSQNELAKVIGKSRSHVANTLRLMKLPESVRDLVSSGQLSAGHARTLVTVDDPLSLAKRIIEGGLSVRQAEALAKRSDEAPGVGEPNSKKPAKSLNKNADIVALENRLRDVLGLNVSVSYNNGSGDVRVHYKNLEQLDDICRRLEQ